VLHLQLRVLLVLLLFPRGLHRLVGIRGRSGGIRKQ
jgi:hypothetical protein